MVIDFAFSGIVCYDARMKEGQIYIDTPLPPDLLKEQEEDRRWEELAAMNPRLDRWIARNEAEEARPKQFLIIKGEDLKFAMKDFWRRRTRESHGASGLAS